MGAPTIFAVGNLGSDPESKFINSGTMITEVSLATNEVSKDKEGNRVNKTIWFRVKVWGKLGEFVSQYFSKGSTALVTGRLGQEEYTDKAGQLRQVFVITANSFEFVGPKQDNANGGNGNSQAQPARPAPRKTDDDFLATDWGESELKDTKVPF